MSETKSLHYLAKKEPWEVADMGKNPQRKSIYEIKLKSSTGEDDILSKYKGKVTLITNTTGHCGNAPQFGILEELYRKYKDRGFEVLAVPTNDFCGPKVTYGIYEDGITSGKMSEDYAREEWDVTYGFTDLVVSVPFRDAEKDDPEKTPHELYLNLNPDQESAPMYGNFEKFIVDRSGKVVWRLPNFVLLNFAYEGGLCDSPEVELKRLEEKIEEILDQPWDGESYIYDGD